jgi:hypothetical protein
VFRGPLKGCPFVGMSLKTDFLVGNLVKPLPHPGCFSQRVRKRLKINELSFACLQESAKECARM